MPIFRLPASRALSRSEELGPPPFPLGTVDRLPRCPGVASEDLDSLGLGETSGANYSHLDSVAQGRVVWLVWHFLRVNQVKASRRTFARAPATNLAIGLPASGKEGPSTNAHESSVCP